MARDQDFDMEERFGVRGETNLRLNFAHDVKDKMNTKRLASEAHGAVDPLPPPLSTRVLYTALFVVKS